VKLNNDDNLAIGDYTLVVTIDQEPTTQNARAGNTDPFSDAASFDPFKGEEQDWTPPSAQSDDPFADDWDMNSSPMSPQTPASDSGSPSISSEGDWADWDSESVLKKETNQKSKLKAPVDDFDWLPGTSDETVSIPPSFPDNSPPQQPVETPVSRPASERQQPDALRIQHSAAQNRVEPLAAVPSRQTLESASTGISKLLDAAALKESDFQNQTDAQVLEQTGRVLNQMVDAMMVLLQSRAEIKNAIRSDVTTLGRTDNNPLKFSFNASDALTKLLSENAGGYLHADVAIQEAVDDLKLHQVAMLEGMKAAVKSMLLQFDPSKLEQTLGKKGGITANIPLTRDAKLWELFCEQYDAIREEAVNDFGDAFGKEFRKAYETRIRKLGRKPDF